MPDPELDPDQKVPVRRGALTTVVGALDGAYGPPPGHPASSAVLGALSELRVASSVAGEESECGMCRVPLATGRCPHVIIADGRVTMTERKWRELVDELRRLRNLEGEVEGTRTSQTPDGFTDARWHVDAIADSGVGYNAERHWHLTCAWCPWEATGATKTEVVESYRAHERQRTEAAELEMQEAGRG